MLYSAGRYLHMNSVQESDRGWYMCQVSHKLKCTLKSAVLPSQINTDPMVHRSGYVQVVVPPAISQVRLSRGRDSSTIALQAGPHDLVVREGENVTLSCEASGYPPPHIVWRREDGEDILVQGRKVI